MTPDVNVLVAASRDDHPHHAAARVWLESSIAQADAGTPFSLMPMVVASFLRLVTSSKIFNLPTPIADAVALVVAAQRLVQTMLAKLRPLRPQWRQMYARRGEQGIDKGDGICDGRRRVEDSRAGD